MSNSERFLWVCELNKDEPIKKWKATDLTEEDDEDDQDYVLHSLVVKTAVLGAKSVDGERNLIALKTKGYHDKEFEQPIFSLTLGKNDMISNLDLIISTRANQDVEFKLVEGTGPVFITCMHVLEIPSADENQTIMTTSDVDVDDEDDDEEDEEAGEEDMEEKAPPAAKGGRKGAAAAKNGKAAAAKPANGKADAKDDKEEAEAEEEEKPKKRKRN